MEFKALKSFETPGSKHKTWRLDYMFSENKFQCAFKI